MNQLTLSLGPFVPSLGRYLPPRYSAICEYYYQNYSMFTLTLVGGLLAYSVDATDNKVNIDFHSIVTRINADKRSTWTATLPSDRDIHRANDLIGGYIPYTGTPPMTKTFATRVQVPDQYDARLAHPFCPSIRRIRDQCGCGSCFAFGSIEAFEDRICIHNKKNITLSAEDIISCHNDENMSCQGGNPIAVWQNIFAGRKAGDGAIQDSCYPYTIPTCPCNHHSLNSSLPNCPTEGTISTPQCDFGKKFSCEDKGIWKSQTPNLISAQDMEQEIFQNGPITVAYTVYDDFLTYKSGVYQKSENAKALGGHSVKIVGYGTQNGVEYWTVANSWNAEWGDNGFFKIKRGVNECNIESDAVVAGIPVTTKPQ
jgi:cathepsin B